MTSKSTSYVQIFEFLAVQGNVSWLWSRKYTSFVPHQENYRHCYVTRQIWDYLHHVQL